MKKFLLGATALALLSAPALAADLPARTYTKAPAYAPPVQIYNWTGFYLGGHVGGAFGDSNSLVGDSGRFMGGVQGGADYQFNTNWVLGIEAQYSWAGSNNNGAVFPLGTVVNSTSDSLGSVTGRLGYTWGPAMLYGKGGYAWRDNGGLTVSSNVVNPAFTVSGHDTNGYTVGGGLEYLFSTNWSGKIEYQYYNFGNTTFTSGPADITGRSFNSDLHTVKAGLNYRFGWGGFGGPDVVRY